MRERPRRNQEAVGGHYIVVSQSEVRQIYAGATVKSGG